MNKRIFRGVLLLILLAGTLHPASSQTSPRRSKEILRHEQIEKSAREGDILTGRAHEPSPSSGTLGTEVREKPPPASGPVNPDKSGGVQHRMERE
jgi:hypothetical protein